MKFKEYLSNAWMTHEMESKKILDEAKENFKLMETEDDVMSMARLIAHISGEHLGQWEKGIDLLRKMKNNATIKDKNEMNRLVGMLNLGNFPNTDITSYSYSDQSRILAMTSSALANLGGLKNAGKFLKSAIQISDTHLEKLDPANKTIAMMSHNIASALEKKMEQSENQKEFMVFAANAARRFWEIAGTWKEIERAEYQLALTYLKASQNQVAHKCAHECLRIVNENHDETLELFFAYEVIILTSLATGNISGLERTKELFRGTFDRLSIEDQSWCKATLDKVENLEK